MSGRFNSASKNYAQNDEHNQNLCGPCWKCLLKKNITLALGSHSIFLVLKSEETVALFRGISRCWVVIANGLSKDYAQLLLLKFFIYFSSILTLALGQCFWVE